MAKEFGPFLAFDWETEKDCEFYKTFPKELLVKMKKHGRRNISILTNAPTGTVSILSGSSSGIEPTFRQSYTRRRKINDNDVNVKVDFVDSVGDKWANYLVVENNVKKYFESIGKEVPKSEEELRNQLPDYFISSDKIDWKKRVEIQSAIQSSIDHSISSTRND
jgi:ribonucleoside-diphosphate reductase alpha chain